MSSSGELLFGEATAWGGRRSTYSTPQDVPPEDWFAGGGCALRVYVSGRTLLARDMSEVTSESIASPESLDDVARRELGETPAVKRTALEELRQLISGAPSLNCPTDDDFLVKFLRARKYDTQSAFENIKKYFKVRRDRPELFEELTPSSIPFDVVCRKHQLLTVSRRTDPLGRMVLLMKIGSWNTEMCTLNDFFRVGIALAECFLLRQDFQNCLPLRLQKVYIINNPPIFDYLFAIAKTFLKAKLVKRIRLLGYNLTELHQLVPDDVISKEHEGTNESFDYDQLERELKTAENFFQALSSYGYRETLSTKRAPEPNGVLADEELSSEDYVHL
ncbi:alpha-tocopherol transfer protein-like isoform X2 [Dermacentor andersoni]|uniref:alpha-tocopherol transfer protein-like isoform X2 n=1 Tax=Dermacentor andersoni TaxID=34620 RepID=UPI003B3BD6D3